ncbi:hypothetical protein BH09ACT10_BH09ACT10_06990 [soil metagenome]
MPFDPTDLDLADALCSVCEEPASFAVEVSAGDPVLVCKVCAHYIVTDDEDSLVARSADPSAATDDLARELLAASDALVPFQIGQDVVHDDWG